MLLNQRSHRPLGQKKYTGGSKMKDFIGKQKVHMLLWFYDKKVQKDNL
jgi:hypothetical protein